MARTTLGGPLRVEPISVKRVAFCTFGCRLNQYDSEALRTLMRASLEQCSFEVVEAGDGNAALEAFSKEREIPLVRLPRHPRPPPLHPRPLPRRKVKPAVR